MKKDAILFGAAACGIVALWLYFTRREGSRSNYASPTSCPPTDSEGDVLVDKTSIDNLEECIADLQQTKTLHTVDGEYTPERKELHKKIINDIIRNNECIDPPGHTQPIAILTGGVPGSGKSTFIKKYAPWMMSKKILLIDADEIRAELPEYEGWNASQTHEETRDIVMELLESIGTPCKFDALYDGTMNKARKYEPLIKSLNDMGYKTYVIFMEVPKKVSKERVLGRYEHTGRYVPREIVEEANDAGLKAFDRVKTMVNGWILVDGMTGKVTGEGGEEIPRHRFWKEK